MLFNINNFPNMIRSWGHSRALKNSSSTGKCRLFHLNISVCWHNYKVFIRVPLTIKRSRNGRR